MLLIPYRMETSFTRVPYANAAIIAVTSIVFFLPEEILSMQDFYSFVLRDWDTAGLIGSLFLHGGFFHLLGNMMFLWIFGNAVCAASGNAAYPVLYLCLGVFAGAVHLMADAHPAIGASGAINGVVGMTLILFPRNKLHVWYWFAIPFLWIWRTGTIIVRTFWMILYWLIFDILGTLGSNDGVGHWAHIGGFIGGVIVGLCALWFKLVETPHHTLLDMIAGRSEEEDALRSVQLESSVGSALGFAALMTGAEMPLQMTEPPSESKVKMSPRPAKPDVQLLRCVGGGSTITCYIVNRGSTMNQVTLKAPVGVVGKMSTTTSLTTGETGWIRFITQDQSTIDSIEFMLRYMTSGGISEKIRFRCVPSLGTLTVVPTTHVINS